MIETSRTDASRERRASPPGRLPDPVLSPVGAYASTAIVVLNTLLFLVFVNAALYFVFRAKDGRDLPPHLVQKYGMPTLLEAYRRPESDVMQLLRESEATLYLEHEQFTEFRPGRVSGRFVNVVEEGYRRGREQAPWPAPSDGVNLFFFGGSTTFGLNVADEETIPSHLQDLFLASQCERPVHVYNFGRHWYFSSQERLLFEQLLLAGHVPDVALFLDGLNDFASAEGEAYTAPRFAEFMRQANRPRGAASHAAAFLGSLPMSRAAGSLATRLGITPPPPEAAAPRALDDRAFADAVLRRWTANKRLVEAAAAEYGIRTLFIWQPVPTYGYDLERHFLHGKESFDDLARHEPGYARFDEARRTDPALARNFLWLADLQRESGENLYVDKAHYTGEFSQQLASRIHADLIARGLVPCVAPSTA